MAYFTEIKFSFEKVCFVINRACFTAIVCFEHFAIGLSIQIYTKELSDKMNLGDDYSYLVLILTEIPHCDVSSVYTLCRKKKN